MAMNEEGRTPASVQPSEIVSAGSFDTTENTIAANAWKAFQALAINHWRHPTRASLLKKEEAYRAFYNAFVEVSS
ncbi:hypothetical protein WV31_05550 [Magnetospirillum sp. ME-1]|uniref:hypothetical protein n=1 Tax=Magnetospirillum sp. ME-1 TaxID=1639348 RepID=UPI000A179EB3|nr:hypothetical protein [Magnetospirillum sp. ME-1]ARJ65161.1 hypothetical protein WV31_05550 [Magnetospirillum sp. ME-1]